MVLLPSKVCFFLCKGKKSGDGFSNILFALITVSLLLLALEVDGFIHEDINEQLSRCEVMRRSVVEAVSLEYSFAVGINKM